MKIKQITLHNYRNYIQLNLNIDHPFNIFIGENAQGKTNIIEAIYYAAIGHSHRNNTDQELIYQGKKNAVIRLFFERFGVEQRLEFYLSEKEKRKILYNSHPIKQKELVGVMNVVLFSPEDLSLIKGIPAGRRKFLDFEISQANQGYYHQLLKYNRIILQRNILLKKIKDHKAVSELLDGWDMQLSTIAAEIVAKRMDVIKKLNMLANLMHRKISDHKESLELTYSISGKEDDVSEELIPWYNNRLKKFHQNDILRGSTSVGPHRDDIIFKVNNVNLKSFGSQGQQRTAVLALKLAELEFMKSETGEYPILLLDDVMSELDIGRREKLLLFIRNRIQTFITATDLNYFPDKHIGKSYDIHAGKVME